MVKQNLIAVTSVAILTLMTAGAALAQTVTPSPTASPTSTPRPTATASPTVPGGAPATGMGL